MEDIDESQAEMNKSLGRNSGQNEEYTWERNIAVADGETFQQQIERLDKHIRKYTFGNDNQNEAAADHFN